MKLISWNVNGLRACLKKDFMASFTALDADIFCLQETKLQHHAGQVELELPGYHQFWNSAEKKGLFRHSLLVQNGTAGSDHRHRAGTARPRGTGADAGIPRLLSGKLLHPQQSGRAEASGLPYGVGGCLPCLPAGTGRKKPVILCGDLNVAHTEMDIKNAKTNRMSAGFTDQERAKMTTLLQSGFCDTFRTLYPDTVKYSWWSYRFNSRAKNKGWRIDYCMASEAVRPMLKEARILNDAVHSDHCPMMLELTD